MAAETMKLGEALYRWLGVPPAEQPPDHYRLLGLTRFEADPTVIGAAAGTLKPACPSSPPAR